MASPLSLEVSESITLHGVTFAQARAGGRIWRIGSLKDNWSELLTSALAASAVPGERETAALAADQIWICSAQLQPPDLTAMCCGLGASWPGMGRELYACFPCARQAMDAVAALADWDILQLLDEADGAKIAQTRYQIPYLFMLEYGQWSMLRQMGLRPSLICGHSLGELIALCFSGILSLESAWCLLETRAEHMAELETKSGHKGGMLAVPAPLDVIEEIIGQFPQLLISNRNTERQFVLSGPREYLLEARRILRKRRIPAIMLGMDLAFHNPAMRILRDMSLRRLQGLSMRPPEIPMLSCVDASPYPDETTAISTRIADLDENAVDWCRLLSAITADQRPRIFLELGPQETLCSITSEQTADTCMAVDRKGQEALAMRTVLALLFALGYLNLDKIKEIAQNMPPEQSCSLPPLLPAKDEDADLPGELVNFTKSLIAELSDRKAEEITLAMDLRQDLDIRSSSLPYLLLEAERRLGRTIPLENLFQLFTVADLVRFVGGLSAAKASAQGLKKRYTLARKPFVRFVWERDKLIPDSLRLKPRGNSISSPAPGGSKLVLILAFAEQFCPWAEAALQALGYTCKIINPSENNDLYKHITPLSPAGVLVILKLKVLHEEAAASPERYSRNTLNNLLEHLKSDNSRDLPWIRVLCPLQDTSAGGEWRDGLCRRLEMMAAQWQNLENVRFIIWLTTKGYSYNALACTDMLTRELYAGSSKWAVWSTLAGDANPSAGPSSVDAGDIAAAKTGNGEIAGNVFRGDAQFSALLERHFDQDSEVAYNPAAENSAMAVPWIFPGQLLRVLAEAGSVMLPWLGLTGFTDVRFAALPSLPLGVTRECELRCSARLALSLEGVPTRCCHGILDVAAIKGNGRKSGLRQPVCDSVCLLTPDEPVIRPLWTKFKRLDGQPMTPDKFENVLSLTDRLFKSVIPIEICDNISDEGAILHGYEADLGAAICENPFALTDLALFACLMSLAKFAGEPKALLDNLGKWRFSAIGFMCFQKELHISKLQWHTSWDDGSLHRFDAQGLNDSDLIQATIQSIEFDRVNPCVGDSEVEQ